MKLILLGSCVTRDIFGPQFENGWNDLYINMSFNRSSLISLASEPFSMDVSSNEFLNPFERRALGDDLHKTFYRYLSKLHYEGQYLLLDFVEERFNLFHSEGKYATVSNEFLKSKIAESLPGEIINRFSAENHQRWREACLFLLRKAKEKFPPDHIILHKAFWMNTFVDGDQIHFFPDQDTIDRQNSMLTAYYQFFEEHCPGIRILDLSHRHYHADKNHQWGLGAMHYEKGYYAECMALIRQVSIKDLLPPSQDSNKSRVT